MLEKFSFCPKKWFYSSVGGCSPPWLVRYADHCMITACRYDDTPISRLVRLGSAIANVMIRFCVKQS